MHYLENVNYTNTAGEDVSYDENGNSALPILDVLNWVWLDDGPPQILKVGEFKKLASGDEELTIEEDRMFWNFESKKVTLVF